MHDPISACAHHGASGLSVPGRIREDKQNVWYQVKPWTEAHRAKLILPNSHSNETLSNNRDNPPHA
jgi:hypothetical protein